MFLAVYVISCLLRYESSITLGLYIRYLYNNMYQVRFITSRANISNRSYTLRSAKYEGANSKKLGVQSLQLRLFTYQLSSLKMKNISGMILYSSPAAVCRRACASRENKIVVTRKKHLQQTSRKMSISYLSRKIVYLWTRFPWTYTGFP